MQETQYSGNEIRNIVMTNEPEAADMFAVVKEIFPWVEITDYASVSTATHHEVLGEPVVTCVLPSPQTAFLVGREHAITARKFLLNSKKSYLRGYKLYQGDLPAWAPQSARILCYGINMIDYGRPAPEGLDTFEDFYFAGDPADVEAHLSLPELRGSYDTYYGVTLVNGQIVRTKQYVYEEQTAYSDWDVLYWFRKKQIDLAAEQAASEQSMV
jgi:hypothetical protein